MLRAFWIGRYAKWPWDDWSISFLLHEEGKNGSVQFPLWVDKGNTTILTAEGLGRRRTLFKDPPLKGYLSRAFTITQNKHTWAPRFGTVVRCQWLANGSDRPLHNGPFLFWSATKFLREKFCKVSVEVNEDLFFLGLLIYSQHLVCVPCWTLLITVTKASGTDVRVG